MAMMLIWACYCCSNFSGQKYGLQLLLFANEAEYTAPRTDVGFRLMVHGHDEIPDITNHGTTISPGTTTTVGLKTTLVSQSKFVIYEKLAIETKKK